MKESVKINGESYSINFGTWCVRNFEIDTGVGIDNIFADGSQTGQMLDLVWHGLKDGARIDKREFTIDKPELSDLLDLDAEQCKTTGEKPAALVIGNLWLKSRGIDINLLAENQEETETETEEKKTKTSELTGAN